jgi:phospholipid/cholesterol/gamma-HCH transport system substrate-binding protein
MKNTLETRLGLFVALIMLATFFVLVIVGGVEKFQRGLHLHALFSSAQELKVGDRVKLAGVEIGKVERITLAENKVKVTMKLRASTIVKTDSTAAIKFAGLMGQSFVSLDFGTAAGKQLDNDQFVNTIEQPDFGAILQKLENVATGVENLTKSFTGDKIDNLLGPFTDFLKQNSAPLTATISNLNSASAQIASGKGTVGKLIFDDSPTNLYNTALATVSNLQTTGDEIKITLADARKILDGVNAGEGSLGKLVKDEKLYLETTASMTNLKEILQKINGGQGTVGKLINDQEFYKNAKFTLQKLDKATEELEDSGPLGVLTAVVGKLF